MFGSRLPPVVCRRAHVLFMLFVFICIWCPTHIVFCFVFLRLVYPMLTVSLDCFCFVFLRLVYPMLSVSLGCVVFLFCFSSSCVPYVDSFSELSFFYCPIGILWRLFTEFLTILLQWKLNVFISCLIGIEIKKYIYFYCNARYVWIELLNVCLKLMYI